MPTSNWVSGSCQLTYTADCGLSNVDSVLGTLVVMLILLQPFSFLHDSLLLIMFSKLWSASSDTIQLG